MRVQCGACALVMEAPPEFAGQMMACARCGGHFQVPAAAPVAAGVPAAGEAPSGRSRAARGDAPSGRSRGAPAVPPPLPDTPSGGMPIAGGRSGGRHRAIGRPPASSMAGRPGRQGGPGIPAVALVGGGVGLILLLVVGFLMFGGGGGGGGGLLGPGDSEARKVLGDFVRAIHGKDPDAAWKTLSQKAQKKFDSAAGDIYLKNLAIFKNDQQELARNWQCSVGELNQLNSGSGRTLLKIQMVNNPPWNVLEAEGYSIIGSGGKRTGKVKTNNGSNPTVSLVIEDGKWKVDVSPEWSAR